MTRFGATVVAWACMLRAAVAINTAVPTTIANLLSFNVAIASPDSLIHCLRPDKVHPKHQSWSIANKRVIGEVGG